MYQSTIICNYSLGVICQCLVETKTDQNLPDYPFIQPQGVQDVQSDTRCSLQNCFQPPLFKCVTCQSRLCSKCLPVILSIIIIRII